MKINMDGISKKEKEVFYKDILEKISKIIHSNKPHTFFVMEETEPGGYGIIFEQYKIAPLSFIESVLKVIIQKYKSESNKQISEEEELRLILKLIMSLSENILKTLETKYGKKQ